MDLMTTASKLTFLRLVLCGGIVGVSLGNILGIDISVLSPWLDSSLREYLNAGMGAVTTAFILKLLHVVT